jgi:hypothetical protein
MTKSRQIAPPRRPWAPDEVALLCARYAEHRTADIAAQLGRPLKHVYSKATRLGLRKSAAFLQRDVSGRMLKGGALSVATQFKPGSVPWNKGKHYEALGRSIDTQFKPGGTPHTWKPIGSLRINADGYLQRKCSDTRYPPRDWVSIHRSVWEAANGPVPHGCVVVFVPGRKTTDEAAITPDAVECITRRQLMARNTLHALLPKPLAKLVQLRGALARQINRKAKQAQQAQDAQAAQQAQAHD